MIYEREAYRVLVQASMTRRSIRLRRVSPHHCLFLLLLCEVAVAFRLLPVRGSTCDASLLLLTSSAESDGVVEIV